MVAERQSTKSSMTPLTRDALRKILTRWNIEPTGVLPECRIPGSPERCLHRSVVEDASGRRFVLEELDPASLHRKTTIAERIDRMAGSHLAVTPYCRGNDGDWIQCVSGACWQVAPYVDGIILDRASYWKEAWRGESAARFLIDMHRATRGWEMNEPPFLLPDYIDRLMNDIRRNDPQVLPEVKPFHELLCERLYPVIDNIPLIFCHGDPHPLNTIWGSRRIISVIDWEFCGWKPMFYDAALVVGCVGAEDTDAREGQFITAFLNTLRRSDPFSKTDPALLPLFVLAVRFAWLAEWLRRKDGEMIGFELFYMRLVMEG